MIVVLYVAEMKREARIKKIFNLRWIPSVTFFVHRVFVQVVEDFRLSDIRVADQQHFQQVVVLFSHLKLFTPFYTISMHRIIKSHREFFDARWST